MYKFTKLNKSAPQASGREPSLNFVPPKHFAIGMVQMFKRDLRVMAQNDQSQIIDRNRTLAAKCKKQSDGLYWVEEGATAEEVADLVRANALAFFADLEKAQEGI